MQNVPTIPIPTDAELKASLDEAGVELIRPKIIEHVFQISTARGFPFHERLCDELYWYSDDNAQTQKARRLNARKKHLLNCAILLAPIKLVLPQISFVLSYRIYRNIFTFGAADDPMDIHHRMRAIAEELIDGHYYFRTAVGLNAWILQKIGGLRDSPPPKWTSSRDPDTDVFETEDSTCVYYCCRNPPLPADFKWSAKDGLRYALRDDDVYQIYICGVVKEGQRKLCDATIIDCMPDLRNWPQ